MSGFTEQKSNKAKNVANYLLSLSIFCLAMALVYFTWQISLISQQIPDILLSVEKTSEKIEPVVKQVNEIKELIPPIITEISEIRKQTPLILTEIQKTRQQIPAITQTVDKMSLAVNKAANEVNAARPLVPKLLKEVKATREAIPSMLDRADKLVVNARQAGKEASKGAVTGMLTGIITAPFEMVGSLGKKVLSFSELEAEQFTQADIELAKQAAHEVLSSDKVNYSSSWKSQSSDAEGKVLLLDIEKNEDSVCKLIQTKAWKAGNIIANKKITACLDESGNWERQGDE